MPKLAHKKISEQLIALDKLPEKKEELVTWVKAGAHLKFLKDNAHSPEIVVYAIPRYSFIHSMVVPEKLLEPLDKDDLMHWSGMNPSVPAASYVSGGGRGVWIERGEGDPTGSKILAKGTNIIYERTFEGWPGEGRDYFELSQEYAHLEHLHWRPEQHSFCRYDENGDLLPVVSITTHASGPDITLVTFIRSSLDTYLAASNQVLVRFFDFTLRSGSNFHGWGDGEEQMFDSSDEIFYKQKICDSAAYTRGVQIIRPSCQKTEIFSKKKSRWLGEDEKNHVEFIAYNFRNRQVLKISTNPEATTNYFQAENNNLPFETSPAFFKPEVLDKYKADKDKYTVGERDIHCRAAWCLEAFDVNEAGQIFVYICYLRRLPHSELLYWLSCNEKPKAPISERAHLVDFKGEFSSFIDPLEKIKQTIRIWDEKKYLWWQPRGNKLINDVTVPLTSSRDEWGDSFLRLIQLINEGFIVKEIRAQLETISVVFDTKEGSLSLLEKLINNESDNSIRLTGLRDAQHIRTKTKGHSSQIDAEKLALQALSEHETYAAHFRYICEKIHAELQVIQNQFIIPRG